jgi:hypothetical protein
MGTSSPRTYHSNPDGCTPKLADASLRWWPSKMTLTDEDILARLTAVEDATVERKTSSDNRDWIKAAVAFSNTLENEQPGILFVGVYNDGRIEEVTAQNFEKLQNRVSDELSNIYPPIYPMIQVREKEGRKFLAVVIYGSPNRPHFAGKSYRRDGTRTVDASEPHIEQFIALRSSKVAEILKWKGKVVTFRRSTGKDLNAVHVLGSGGGRLAGKILDCNQFYLTAESLTVKGNAISFPLQAIEIGFDHYNQCLELYI